MTFYLNRLMIFNLIISTLQCKIQYYKMRPPSINFCDIHFVKFQYSSQDQMKTDDDLVLDSMDSIKQLNQFIR